MSTRCNSIISTYISKLSPHEYALKYLMNIITMTSQEMKLQLNPPNSRVE